jgi:hypothetical protein
MSAKGGPGGYLTGRILASGSGVFCCEICKSTRSSLEMRSLFGSDEPSDEASRAGDKRIQLSMMTICRDVEEDDRVHTLLGVRYRLPAAST